jgi:aldehyde dehydrogenase (NAD+)
MREFKSLINGKLVPGVARLDVINPATEEVLAEAPRADRAQLNEAIAAAKAAFPAWSAKPIRERGALLVKLADALEARQDEFARLLTLEQGKPLPEAHWEIGFTIRIIRHHATLDLPNKILKEDETQKIVRHYTPLGVVAAIVPWNFPMLLLAIKVAPALLAGNTLVAKPAPTTPLTTLRLGEICSEILPAGVINVIVDHNDLGDALSSHADVAKVAFTGSTATGKRIMEACASTLKPTFLELGGKSVNLVLEDADLAATVPFASMVCMHGGQGCAMPTRLMVPNSKMAETEELLKAAFAGVGYGDPTDPSNIQGPQVSKKQQERVLGYIEQGKQEGARVLLGGGVPEHLEKGFYVEPTVFVDVDPDSTIAQEEIFGPVLVVIGFDDDDDAVRIANNSIYGLSGVVTSGDLERGKAVARRIRTGTIGVNGGLWYGADAPFGGYKQSGIGRQCGIEGLEIFTETKTVAWPA